MAVMLFTSAAAAERKPNILIIMADDLGYADLGFQGVQDIPTPSMDALARSGVRFTSGYVSGTWCSPTRAGLLTGRYQERWAHESGGLNPLFPLSETTIADRLRAAGYATGIVGKWHLGTSPDFHPQQRGFDEFFGFLDGGHSYHMGLPNIVFPDRTGAGQDFGSRMEGNILRGTDSVEESEYLTDAFGREAVSFIVRHQADPFFLYLSFNAVHTPMHADDVRLAKFAAIEDPVRRIYAAMTLAMDDAIGRVIDKLKQLDLEEDTLIFFLSDNGGPTVHKFAYNASRNTPLRGSKGFTLEGGIRVPFVVSWKGHLSAGEDYDQPVIQLDILPTALAAAGVEAEPDWKLDGVNILPQLRNQSTAAPHEALYWRSMGQMAVRQGDWKLVTYMNKIDEGDVLRSENPPPTPHRLYNLRDDIGESNDLAASETKKVEELMTLWNQWNATMAEPQRRTQTTASQGRAPVILATLDADGDERISESEALGALKQNFDLIDSNNDGGIDIGELATMLATSAGQSNSRFSQASVEAAPDGRAGPSYGQQNPDAASFMIVSPDRMFYMLNVAKIRETAVYEDGRETQLSGREADLLYDPMPEVQRVGGGMVYAGNIAEQLAGSGPKRDRVAIVMYPSRAKFNEMASSSAFQETSVHKSASIERSEIMVTTPEAWALSDETPLAASEIPYPATAQDSSFTLLHLVKYRDVAQYPVGSNEAQRSGREAMEIYEGSVEGILHQAGVTPMLRAQVDGVLIGDGRSWSDYRLLRFPSHRAYEAVLQQIEEREIGHHLAAAIEDEYTLELQDLFDATANPPTPGNVGQASSGQSLRADQAPLILLSRDSDKDGKISRSEAVDGMKANFSLLDSNGDGGIDLDELKAILEQVATQGEDRR
jgi:arylsulfatase A-like enzyme/uncharacterized protein (DUF1330 family)